MFSSSHAVFHLAAIPHNRVYFISLLGLPLFLIGKGVRSEEVLASIGIAKADALKHRRING